MLTVKSITKKFPGVLALDNVDFDTRKGEIHALVGENGAGKSTLTKIIAGAYKPDSGVIYYNGVEVSWESPHESREVGISVIYQEFNLFPELSVAENIFLGYEPLKKFRCIDYSKMKEESQKTLDKLGVFINPATKVKELSVAQQQMVEIAKSMCNQTRLFILDEPTAGISDREAELLFQMLSVLKSEGVSIIYISHRLGEIFKIADRVTVLKDGHLVNTVNVTDINRNRLVSMMVGRELKDIYPPKGKERGNEVLSVKNLCIGALVKSITFSLHRGEILGLAGLVGSRRTELAHGIFGSLPISDGSCMIGGQPFRSSSPDESIRKGIAFLTEDRKTEGLVLGQSVKANITMPTLSEFTHNGFIDFAAERDSCEKEIGKYSIAVRDPETIVGNLSGGNQQKVLFSRWARACGGVLMLDEPTRGVDVGAKVEIYKIIRDLANQGVAILFISSELSEIIGMCDRVVVMREGHYAGELEKEEITEENIMHLATREI